MTTYNTDADVANTAVRAFLTKVGEYYLGHAYNTASGKGKEIWKDIKTVVFSEKCVYCGEKFEKLQIEHLKMFNRTQAGIHHPGNTVPCCSSCNRRRRHANKEYMAWDDHLRQICKELNQMDQYDVRRSRIVKHMTEGKYALPKLSDEEKKSILVISNSLYSNIKMEMTKSLDLHKSLQKSFVD